MPGCSPDRILQLPPLAVSEFVDLQRFDKQIADNDSAPRAIVIDIAIAVAQAEVEV